MQQSLFRWAADRAGLAPRKLRSRFAKYEQWLSGTEQPTLKQLQDFARATHVPIGFFFLSTPPEIKIPIPDFRTKDGTHPADPSPDLLDTIYACQQRQEWYAVYARSTGADALPFVGKLSVGSDVVKAADAIRGMLGFDLSIRKQLSTWEEALRQFIQQADNAGVLVMVSGVVGSNNTRKLNTDEFRGFALSDTLAPLVFINGADTKSAQMFTLAHELAHLWLGRSALSNATANHVLGHEIEQWCNRVAAEILIPLAAFKEEYHPATDVAQEIQRLARIFKVSTLVALRRMFDAGGIARDLFRHLYDAEVRRLVEIMKERAGGGDYYRTTTSRVSHRLTRAIVTAALEGRSTMTEAFRLLGCRKMSTFTELAHHVEVDV
ncbi:MAG: ImmA/IrrE family metallo-endopeptidase [Phycisphaerales bacterium]|nr:ImmA/IrrE family metallo-endopeptidase [Phycisphaerales bacterium]